MHFYVSHVLVACSVHSPLTVRWLLATEIGHVRFNTRYHRIPAPAYNDRINDSIRLSKRSTELCVFSINYASMPRLLVIGEGRREDYTVLDSYCVIRATHCIQIKSCRVSVFCVYVQFDRVKILLNKGNEFARSFFFRCVSRCVISSHVSQRKITLYLNT